MTESINQPSPPAYQLIIDATLQSGFTMASDPLTGTLLRSLAATKPGGRLLELGTGTGLSTSWILDGMDQSATLQSIDNDAGVLAIAKEHLSNDLRVRFTLSDGEAWVLNNLHWQFDFIFADTWHGKYLLLNEVLNMLAPGGIYIVDDMLPQPNWPEGHAEKVNNFIAEIESKKDLHVTKQLWATGIIIAVKKSA